MHAQFSEKLTFLTLRYTYVRVKSFSFSERFAFVLINDPIVAILKTEMIPNQMTLTLHILVVCTSEKKLTK